MKNYTKGVSKKRKLKRLNRVWGRHSMFVPVDKYSFYWEGVAKQNNELLCENLAKFMNKKKVYRYRGKSDRWFRKYLKPVFEKSGAKWGEY